MKFVGAHADDSAPDFEKHVRRVLDMAAQRAVRVKRLNEFFILLRERQLDEIMPDARDHSPKTLENRLEGYDASEINAGMIGWLADNPSDKGTFSKSIATSLIYVVWYT